MSKTKIKICGLTRLCDIDCVNEAKPDYIGFVFAESRRKVTPSQAALMREKLSADITAVGVFVNETIENIIGMGEIIDVIQLHGFEGSEYVEKLKSLTAKPIIATNTDAKIADYFLFDGVNPGSGRTFDWDCIPKTDKPFFLAGGLNITNIESAIRKCNPFAVDISSGVETDGVKDREKIKAITEKVRRLP